MSNITEFKLASGLRGINKRNELVITPLNFDAIPFVLFPSKKYEFQYFETRLLLSLHANLNMGISIPA